MEMLISGHRIECCLFDRNSKVVPLLNEAFCSTCSSFIRIATPLAFFAMRFWQIVVLTPSGNCVRHIVSSQDDVVAGLLGR